MRVISGTLKGRVIKGYDIEGTRPTMARVKESIFSSIQGYIQGSLVLDLFAGSGSLGVEAISNGAKEVYFVDNNKRCARYLQEMVDKFGIGNQCQVMLMDYRVALKKFRDFKMKFDIIFIDPPYDCQNINEVVKTILEYEVLNDKGILVLEFRYDNVVVDKNSFTLHKCKKYGDKFVYIYKNN